MNQAPHAAAFGNSTSASAAAKVRNALVIKHTGRITDIHDYYRRDDNDNPMPVEWRDLYGRSFSIPRPYASKATVM